MTSIKKSNMLPQREINADDATRFQSTRMYLKIISLNRLRESFVSVDHFPSWTNHIVWSKKQGDNVRDLVTKQYAPNMVFMGLILSSELGVFFSPSDISTEMRKVLTTDGGYTEVIFYAGIFLIVSMIFTFFALLATFTAGAIISTVSDTNAHCILRSNIGLNAAQLPSRLIVASIYTFIIWMFLLLWVLVPPGNMIWVWIMITFAAILIFFYIVNIYSALGNLIMQTSAMRNTRVFGIEDEESMFPFELQMALYEKAKENERENEHVKHQYKRGGHSIIMKRTETI